MYNRDGVLKAAYALLFMGVLIVVVAGIAGFLPESWRPYIHTAFGPLLGLNVLVTLYLFMYMFFQEFKDLRSVHHETETKVESTAAGLQSLLDYVRGKFKDVP